MRGTLAVVQEGRFRLDAPNGRSHLFILGHGAAIEPQDLQDLARRGAPVCVSFTAAPGRVAFVAHSVSLLADQAEMGGPT